MPKTITQKVVFKNTTSKALYDLYMNAKKHSKATASPTKITAKEGTKFSASSDYITGTNLKLVKDQLIVQTWRAVDWDAKDPDSILILHFEPKGKNIILNVAHVNVPDKQAKGIDQGWHDYYWEPWKQYLAGKPIAKPKAM